MGLLRWLRHNKQKDNESYKSNVPDTSVNTPSDDSSHRRTFKPIKKKERLRFDKNSDGTLKVTVPADRSYRYEKEQIKNGTYDSAKARKRRNSNYKNHLTYGPILNNDQLMKQISYNMITDKIRVSPRRHDIKGRYDETVNNGMNGQSNTVNGRNQSVNNQSTNAQPSHPGSQSSQPTRVLSHPSKMSSASPQETKNIVQNLQAHNQMNNHPARSASVVAPVKNSASSSVNSSGSMSWIMRRHSELANRASSAKQADIKRAMALKSTAERKTVELSQAASRSVSLSQSMSASTSTVASLRASISNSYSMSYKASYAASVSSSASSYSKAMSYKKSKAIQSKRQSLINSFDNSAGISASPASTSSVKANSVKTSNTRQASSYADNINYINVQTSTVSGLDYSQQLMSKFSSESLSAAKSLANRRQEYFKQLKEVRKRELMRQRVKQIKRRHREEEEERRRKEKISRLKASAAQIEDQIAVYDGSQGSKVRSAARSASASKSASVSASQSRSYASAAASNKASYARKESLLNIAIRQANSSAAKFKKRFKSTRSHLKKVKNQNVDRLKAANASVNVLKKQLKKQLQNDGSNKKLIRRYNHLLKNSVNDANRAKKQLLSNKKALTESSQKNQQLIEASKNNTDVLKAMSKLSVNYKRASGKLKAYKQQVQVYKNKASNMQLAVQKHQKNAVMNPTTIKQIQTLRLNNQRLKTALHRYYINNISGRKKNAKLRRVIESMQRNARHNSNNRIGNASSSTSRYDRTAQLPNDSDVTYNANSKRPKLNGKFKPTHHAFTREGKLASDRYRRDLSGASQNSCVSQHSRVERNNENNGMLNGLFHKHEQENASDYYQSNEVHANQRIFLLGKIVENTGNEKNVYRTGSKYYTLGLIPGATGEEYKTRFVLPTGHAIPARKRLIKLI